jgi:hypothetical protein
VADRLLDLWLRAAARWPALDRLDTLAMRHVGVYRRWRVAADVRAVRRLGDAVRESAGSP